MSLNLATLPAKLKDYALAQRDTLLATTLVADLGFLNYFQSINTLDEIPLTQLVTTSMLQPGGKDAFAPTANAVSFKARIGKTRSCKADLKFTPSMVNAWWKSYLGQIAGGQIKTKEVPFEAFVMERILQQLKQDLHLNAAFKGVYNAAGTTPAATMNGVYTIISNEVTGGGIPSSQVAAINLITSSNAIDEVEKVLTKVPEHYWGQDLALVASPKFKRLYAKCYQQSNGALPYNTEFEKTLVEGTNIEIISEPGMTGVDDFFITPKSNLFFLWDNPANMDLINVEYAERNIKIMVDFEAAPEIGTTDLVFVGDYTAP